MPSCQLDYPLRTVNEFFKVRPVQEALAGFRPTGPVTSERIPVVAYCRPERGVVLNATYGYAGSERDLRGTKIIPAGFLSPQAIRMKLLACLSAGLDVDETRRQAL